VQSASVERILPHTLRILVIEREPLAQASLMRPRAGGGLETVTFQLDAEGYVLLPLEVHQRSGAPSTPAEQLPVIAGVKADELQAGLRIETPQVRAALQLLALFDQSPMAGLVDLQRIDVSSPDTLAVTTGQGTEVTFGLNNLEQQLRRWRSIYDLGQKSNKAIATLDLAVANNIPARWLEASVIPLPPAKSPKPSRYKKKHV
jgi:cell division septal protein FtsQ